MKVALIQMNSVADKAANVAQARALIDEACALEKPDWVGLPEVFDFLGGTREEKFAAAEKLREGPAYALAAELAARHGVFVHAGSILERNRDSLSNTTVVFDRTGREIALYRKIHMFDVVTPDGAAYRESALFTPGTELATYEAEGLRFGCAICYDLRFPALFQALSARGVDVIALPAAFTLLTGKDHWEVLCRARAIETQSFFVAPAQIGPHRIKDEVRHTYGHSLVCDPWGHVVAKASDNPGFVTARLDRGLIAKTRAANPVASQRKPFA
ncbi:nitrilase [Rhodoblastus acidophilus]|uniref:carbon-nitrogen hydrolase family protein n=1 Tax=Rhodoblastus acidophilus TaxID=1074 RepID=UPI0022253CF9|nr:carbon-nitrogen hydrolase family protein [Rhodoblastus acidophilus]MCW2283314.1 nitrilase [Rhodoblastus acidophilus]MCW2332174.1 nitrilase [Rhodoblastus acidophilus]